MNLNDLSSFADVTSDRDSMPVLFLGHGNPMNAITDNEFTRGWRAAGAILPHPRAILCISAHWETRGTLVTAMEKPETIHDFRGFPPELYEVRYPAPGSPELAEETKRAATAASVELDHGWGLDHGCWSVISHLFPRADVPVVQMSLDRDKPPLGHYELAKDLRLLRRKGVLIVGSGNIVHNLGMADWGNPGGFAWAEEANTILKRLLDAGDYRTLAHYTSLGKEVQRAIPTPEHFLPLLYVLGLAEKEDGVTFFNDKLELGSISMTSVKIGGMGV